MSADNENSVFVTMFIGIIDFKTGNLDYCNCGHNPPVYGERRMHTSQTVFRFLDDIEYAASAPKNKDDRKTAQGSGSPGREEPQSGFTGFEPCGGGSFFDGPSGGSTQLNRRK